MALDHYVSQVHLRKFYSPTLGKRLHAIRKSNLERFTPRTKEVCRIEEGSTNAYLRHDRAIEDFLISVEPRYNAALGKLRVGKIDLDCIHAIAGFVAYVASCAPTAMRLGTGPLTTALEASAKILDRQSEFGQAPTELGRKTLTELLTDGTVHFDVDPKYPQAMGISSIRQRVSTFGNSPWEILRNDDADSPFFTSDFPVAIELRDDGILNRIVPLAPDLCVRIIPDVRLAGAHLDLSFAKFSFRERKLARAAVVEINRLIVQCAEDVVFYRDDRDWISAFVAKYRDYCIETVTDRIPHGTGFVIDTRQRIVRHPKRATAGGRAPHSGAVQQAVHRRLRRPH